MQFNIPRQTDLMKICLRNNQTKSNVLSLTQKHNQYYLSYNRKFQTIHTMIEETILRCKKKEDKIVLVHGLWNDLMHHHIKEVKFNQVYICILKNVFIHYFSITN